MTKVTNIELFAGCGGLALGLEQAGIQGTLSAQYKQIGNAVPVEMARRVGKKVVKALLQEQDNGR